MSLRLTYNLRKFVGSGIPPAALGGTGFPACAPHRQDAAATKNFSEQLLMGHWPTHKLRKDW